MTQKINKKEKDRCVFRNHNLVRTHLKDLSKDQTWGSKKQKKIAKKNINQ